MKEERKMVSKTIADYMQELDLSVVPAEVVEKTKILVFDTLCVALGGSYSKEARIVHKVMSNFEGKPESTVINSNMKLPAPHAALINATMAHCLELDDTDRFTYYHPGAPIIMASLAVAEEIGCTGKQLLEGILAGYEVSMRIADAVNPSHRDKGFHTTGTIGTFGAGIAVAKLLGLERDEIIHALGISGTQAAGLFEFLNDGSMTKRIHPGKGAWNGILAARLAKEGMTGPATILEGENGFLRATSDDGDVAMLTDRLGENYRIMRMGIKRHAACRYCHTAIDAALELRQSYELNIGNIKEVTVLTSRHCYKQTGKASASTLMASQLSTPYATALAFVKGSAGIDEYTEGLANNKVLTLMEKINVKEYQPFGGYSRKVHVTVEMNDGKSFEKELDLPKGEPENPLTFEEIKAKGEGLAKKVLDDVGFNNLLSYVNGMEEQENLQGLFAIIQ